MDINCTSRCAYQSDGKCTLNMPPSGRVSFTDPMEDNGCLYCHLIEK